MPPYSFGIHLLASGFIGPGTQFEQSRLHPEEELEEEELDELDDELLAGQAA